MALHNFSNSFSRNLDFPFNDFTWNNFSSSPESFNSSRTVTPNGDPLTGVQAQAIQPLRWLGNQQVQGTIKPRLLSTHGSVSAQGTNIDERHQAALIQGTPGQVADNADSLLPADPASACSFVQPQPPFNLAAGGFLQTQTPVNGAAFVQPQAPVNGPVNFQGQVQLQPQASAGGPPTISRLSPKDYPPKRCPDGYRCTYPGCAKVLAVRRDVPRHVRNVHFRDCDDCTVKCHYRGCHFKAGQMVKLKEHIRQHYPESTALSCPLCHSQIRTADESSHTRHLRTHHSGVHDYRKDSRIPAGCPEAAQLATVWREWQIREVEPIKQRAAAEVQAWYPDLCGKRRRSWSDRPARKSGTEPAINSTAESPTHPQPSAPNTQPALSGPVQGQSVQTEQPGQVDPTLSGEIPAETLTEFDELECLRSIDDFINSDQPQPAPSDHFQGQYIQMEQEKSMMDVDLDMYFDFGES